jgi:hypothetical protein
MLSASSLEQKGVATVIAVAEGKTRSLFCLEPFFSPFNSTTNAPLVLLCQSSLEWTKKKQGFPEMAEAEREMSAVKRVGRLQPYIIPLEPLTA